jgi:aminoglycoside phosphotransferase (APT) family kinase protein
VRTFALEEPENEWNANTNCRISISDWHSPRLSGTDQFPHPLLEIGILTTMPDLEISDLLRQLHLDDAVFVARGATARVWRVTARGRVLALRVGAPEASARMRADGAIRRALPHARVSHPLEAGAWNGVEFALDEWTTGEHPKNLERQVCIELGETLAQLHALPCSGFGLLENHEEGFFGITTNPRAGLLTRLEHPFPLASLEESAVSRDAPDSLPLLRDLESELDAVIASEPFVVNHSDLHAGQMLTRNGHLEALLDFGDACIGTNAWDIASFAFFHGWHNTAWLLEGYGPDRLKSAKRFCVVLCLHHLERAVSKPERRARALERLRDTLGRL